MQHVYLGPNRPFDLPLKSGAILGDDPEKVFPGIEEDFEKQPFFRRLFIPVNPPQGLVEARRQLKDPKSPLSYFYNEIQAASRPKEA